MSRGTTRAVKIVFRPQEPPRYECSLCRVPFDISVEQRPQDSLIGHFRLLGFLFRKAMLERVNSDVTFTVSAFLTNCNRGGRKSLITVSLPFSASSRLPFFLIELAP